MSAVLERQRGAGVQARPVATRVAFVTGGMGGMAGFSKALAQEVVKKGVTVNTVSPGYVETDLVMAIRAEVREQIIASIQMGRLARPEEVAAVVAFLASEEAGYITGANISVNGGMHMM